MTTWSAPTALADQSCSRRQAKRLSRQFAEVGVEITPDRLRQISLGSPASETELIDVSFALTASRTLSEKRQSKRGRAQRRCAGGLMVVAGIIVALNILLGMGLVLFILTQHTSPY